MTLRIAWFASARGTSSRLLLRAALGAIERGRLDAEVVCVFCNRERGQSANTDAFLDDVEAAGLPLVASSSLAWRRRVGGAVSDPQGELAAWRRDYDNDAAASDRTVPARSGRAGGLHDGHDGCAV